LKYFAPFSILLIAWCILKLEFKFYKKSHPDVDRGGLSL